MVTIEGGVIDCRRDQTWVILTYDKERERATLTLKENKHGKVLCRGGIDGSRAGRFFERLNVYYFGR
jgi:hypothetical protein